MKKKGPTVPLLRHALDAPTTFSPEALVDAVRAERHIREGRVPEVCVLEFDGDLTDWLVSTGEAKPCEPWACFHTRMFSIEVDGVACGVVPRTIGGPYAVLIAEQMAVSGARVVLGLTSAGRVARKMPVPGLVAATSAVRDEGTSYHYVGPAAVVNAPEEVASLLEAELRTGPLPVVSGRVWTTDAPYRETREQLDGHAKAGVLAVEMQAASLFAFSAASRFPVGVVAFVTNGVGLGGEAFDKGTREMESEILRRICRAGERFVSASKGAGRRSWRSRAR
jgi:uridine phosphorylase